MTNIYIYIYIYIYIHTYILYILYILYYIYIYIYFKQKAELFNSFFANQCSLINDSNIPTDSHLLTDKCLSNVTFTDDDDTVKVVIGLNPNRALERDMISICIKKLCENSIFRLSEFIF